MKTKVATQQSVAFRKQMRIGRELASHLDIVTPLGQVAATLGISDTMVRRIELQALYKVAMRMKEIGL